MKRLFASLIFATTLNAQTAAFPAAVATNQNLGVAVNNCQTQLSSNVELSSVSLTVASTACFSQYTLITIDYEIMQITAKVDSRTLTVTRAFNGSTAARHYSGAIVSALITAWYPNASNAEIKAIETALGAGMANVTNPSKSGMNIVFDGDSLSGTSGTGSAYSAYMTPFPGNPTLTNVSIAGRTCTQLNSEAPAKVDVLYNSSATENIVVIWCGSNDLVGGATPAQTLTALQTYVSGRRAVGFKVIVGTVIDRIDLAYATMTAYNTLLLAATPFYQGLVDFAANNYLGCDGCYGNKIYYSPSDNIHNTAYTKQNILAPLVSTVVSVVAAINPPNYGSTAPPLPCTTLGGIYLNNTVIGVYANPGCDSTFNFDTTAKQLTVGTRTASTNETMRLTSATGNSFITIDTGTAGSNPGIKLMQNNSVKGYVYYDNSSGTIAIADAGGSNVLYVDAANGTVGAGFKSGNVLGARAASGNTFILADTVGGTANAGLLIRQAGVGKGYVYYDNSTATVNIADGSGANVLSVDVTNKTVGAGNAYKSPTVLGAKASSGNTFINTDTATAANSGLQMKSAGNTKGYVYFDNATSTISIADAGGTNIVQVDPSTSRVTIVSGKFTMTSAPTSCAGLPTGTLWNNLGIANFCP